MKKFGFYVLTIAGSVALYEYCRRHGIIDQIKGDLKQRLGKPQTIQVSRLKVLLIQSKVRRRKQLKMSRTASRIPPMMSRMRFAKF